MNLGNLRVSRAVFGLEMLLCFLPLGLLWVGLVTGLGFVGPLPLDAWLLGMLASSVLGPVGLAVAASAVWTGRVRLSGAVVAALVIFAVCTLAGLAVPRFTDFWGQDAIGGAWRDFTLLAVLPTVGVAHLMLLARPHRPALGAG